MIYLQIRFNKTNSFPGNTKKTDGYGKQTNQTQRDNIESCKRWVIKDENMSSCLFSGTKNPASSCWFCRLDAIKSHP